MLHVLLDKLMLPCILGKRLHSHPITVQPTCFP
jgi:hypothetical protein